MRRGGRSARGPVLVGLLGLAVLLGCGTESPPPSPEAALEPLARPFSGARTFERLASLGALGPRPSGSLGAERVRERIEEELTSLDLPLRRLKIEVSVDDGPSVAVLHLIARIPGTLSRDVLLLATPYTESQDAPLEAAPCERETHASSGPALLLELAHALARAPLPYETWIAFVDEGPSAEPGAPPFGSAALVRALADSGELERIRLVLYTARVAERELRVARDLASQRTFRERIFQVAARLGEERRFPAEAAFHSWLGGHQAFAAAGHRGAVALVGRVPEEGAAAAATPASHASEATQEDAVVAHCSAESLEAVGRVALQAVSELAVLLARLEGLAPAAAAPAPSGARAGVR